MSTSQVFKSSRQVARGRQKYKLLQLSSCVAKSAFSIRFLCHEDAFSMSINDSNNHFVFISA